MTTCDIFVLGISSHVHLALVLFDSESPSPYSAFVVLLNTSALGHSETVKYNHKDLAEAGTYITDDEVFAITINESVIPAAVIIIL